MCMGVRVRVPVRVGVRVGVPVRVRLRLRLRLRLRFFVERAVNFRGDRKHVLESVLFEDV